MHYNRNVPREEREEWIKHNQFKKKLYRADFEEDASMPAIIISAIVMSISLMVGIVLLCSYSEVLVIDDKIAMYEEENTRIEERIDAVVSDYMDYEQETFSSLKVDGVDVVFVTYPELKSNDLVVSQMNIYTENNKKIKELKEREFDLRLMRWALIFF